MDYVSNAPSSSPILTFTGDDPIAPPRTAEYFALYLISAGCCSLRLNGRVIPLTAPAAVCLDELGRLHIEEKEGLFVHTVLFHPTFLNINMTIPRIRGKRFQEVSELHALFQLEPFLADKAEAHILTPDGELFNFWISCFDQMRRELREQPDPFWSCRTRSYFMDVISSMEKLYHGFYAKEALPERQARLLSRLLAYVEENLSEPLTVEQATRAFSINKNQLEALFREGVQTTFYDYVRRQRLERVCNYLRFTELGLNEIAGRAGFSSSQNLCRFFRQAMGVSPSAYRKDTVAKRKLFFSSHP